MKRVNKKERDEWLKEGIKRLAKERRARAARDGLGWCAFGGRHVHCGCRRSERRQMAGQIILLWAGIIAAALLINPIFEGLRNYADRFLH